MTITLTETNNLFVDVESAQRTMVRLYNVAPRGVHCILCLRTTCVHDPS